jgi:hypothetical protein
VKPGQVAADPALLAFTVLGLAAAGAVPNDSTFTSLSSRRSFFIEPSLHGNGKVSSWAGTARDTPARSGETT